MRNVFDQYDQAENKLTHALISTLYHEPKLIRPFLKWLRVCNIPSLKNIEVAIQQLPGQDPLIIGEKQNSVPDASFCDNDSWAVILESKVQAGISVSQLRRHLDKASRYGYEDVYLILITVDLPRGKIPAGVRHVSWKSIYHWFATKSHNSNWAKFFVEYMQVYESKMIAQNYDIRGTITMFTGFRFDKENPYTYREGKRLIKVLGEEFRKNKVLVRQLGIDPKTEGRPAITRGNSGAVWDLIPLKIARGAPFIHYPHATMVIKPQNACVAITIPNGIKGGIKKRLQKISIDEFRALLTSIESNVRKIIRKVPGARPSVYVSQRHYKTRRSHPETDGRIEVDLRTLVDRKGSNLKYQPMWVEAIYELLTHKRTNIQFGVQIDFPYSEKCMQSSKAVNAMAEAWIAMKPLLDFVK